MHIGGTFFKKLRKPTGYTQGAFSLALGLSPSSIRNYECKGGPRKVYEKLKLQTNMLMNTKWEVAPQMTGRKVNEIRMGLFMTYTRFANFVGSSRDEIRQIELGEIPIPAELVYAINQKCVRKSA
jgi:DNA-binding XRE family transcriptional regulator